MSSCELKLSLTVSAPTYGRVIRECCCKNSDEADPEAMGLMLVTGVILRCRGFADEPSRDDSPDYTAGGGVHASSRHVHGQMENRTTRPLQSWPTYGDSTTLMARKLWDRQQEAAEQARLLERTRLAELEEQERIAREEEEELARRKERKKYKNKYTPIPNTPLPDTPIFTPCRYADTKVRQGDYCPLFYYTNRGHGSNLTTPALDDETLAFICSESGDVVLQSVAEAKAKNCTLDEDLTWEEFSEANIRMLGDMKRSAGTRTEST
ncbi:hypothetical protein BU15DRAFT_69013 [Melanogaster broomeanus]|nr:hypothetical protein BU15DRAFT_69013 [Melanogaster broomeanus]